MEKRIDILLMEEVGTDVGLEIDVIGEECQSERVALAEKEFHQHGGGIDGEGEFVRRFEVALSFDRE